MLERRIEKGMDDRTPKARDDYHDRFNDIYISLFLIQRWEKEEGHQCVDIDTLAEIHCLTRGIVPGDDQEEARDLFYFYRTYGTQDISSIASHVALESEFLHCRSCYVDNKGEPFLRTKELEVTKLRKGRKR